MPLGGQNVWARVLGDELSVERFKEYVYHNTVGVEANIRRFL